MLAAARREPGLRLPQPRTGARQLSCGTRSRRAASCRSGSTWPTKKAASCRPGERQGTRAHTEVVVAAGKLTARMPGYQNDVTATITGRNSRVKWRSSVPEDERSRCHCPRRRDQTWRFYRRAAHRQCGGRRPLGRDVTGDAGQTSAGVAEFASVRRLTGTILTPIGGSPVPRRRSARRRTAAVAIRRRIGASLRAKMDESGRTRASTGPADSGTSASRPSATSMPTLDTSGRGHRDEGPRGKARSSRSRISMAARIARPIRSSRARS